MTNKEILHADLLDILFEHRNKAYGAYALRKTYNHRLLWALGVSLSFTLLFMFNFSAKKNSPNRWDNGKGLNLSTVQIPEEPRRPDPVKRKPESPRAQKQSTDQIKIVPNDEKTIMPDQTELEKADISGKTINGVAPDGTVNDGGTLSGGNENLKTNNELIVEETDLPSYTAQYPGGIEKFTEFLKRYLNTPDDLEAGEKRIVLVRFMVDVDGTISKAEILQSGGEKYDQEVIRVLRKMPKWVPAMQKGIKVATYFTQPVTFIGIEE